MKHSNIYIETVFDGCDMREMRNPFKVVKSRLHSIYSCEAVWRLCDIIWEIGKMCKRNIQVYSLHHFWSLLTRCVLGYKWLPWTFVCIILIKTCIFGNNFEKSTVLEANRFEPRSGPICGTWSLLKPVCNASKVLNLKYFEYRLKLLNCVRTRYHRGDSSVLGFSLSIRLFEAVPSSGFTPC